MKTRSLKTTGTLEASLKQSVKKSAGFLFASALALASLACQRGQVADSFNGQANDQGIIGGSVVADGHQIAKNTVAIFDVEAGASCTGSIIAEDLVITAGHCLGSGKLLLAFDRNFDQILEVVMNGTEEQFQAIQPKLRGPSRAAMHPNYIEFNKQIAALEERLQAGEQVSEEEISAVVESTDQGDMLLLKFDGGLPAGFEPAKLLAQDIQLAIGGDVTLAGYGYTNGVTHASDDKLRQVSVKIENPTHGAFEVLMNQKSGKGACHGDSGGPAFFAINGVNYLFGVTSRGYKDDADDCSQFAVYSNMVAAHDWMESAKQELAQPAPPPVDEVQPDSGVIGGPANSGLRGALNAGLLQHRNNVVLFPLRSPGVLNRH